jgi:hypothetical protein
MEPTSLEAYENIKASGALGTMQWLVYDAIFHHGPITANALNHLLGRPGQTSFSYHKRLSELRDMGVIKKYGTSTSNDTGQNVYQWVITGALPTKVIKEKKGNEGKPTEKQIETTVGLMRKFYAEALKRGEKLPEDFVAVATWLATGAKCDTCRR